MSHVSERGRGGGRGGHRGGRGGGGRGATYSGDYGTVPNTFGGAPAPGVYVGQPGAYPPAQYGMPAPGPVYGPYGNMGGGGAPRGPPGGKKPPKVATHVQFDASMVFNVATFMQPGENIALLSSFAISYLPPATPGQAPRVSVYTGDAAGIMREFNHNGSWVQTRKAQHEGPVTCLLAVDVWLFVGIQQSAPGGIMGTVKGYNLSNNSQNVLQDPRLSAAHLNSVKCMCAAGQWLVTGGGDGQVKAWAFAQDAATGQGQWALHGTYGGGGAAHTGEVTAMSGKCTGSLITGSATGELKSWRLVDGTLQSKPITAHTGAVAAIDVLSVGPENQFIVTCGEQDSYVRLWKGPLLESLYEMTVQPPPTITPGMTNKPYNPLTALKIIQVGAEQHLFVGMRNGTVSVYHMKDVRHFEKLGFVDGHQRQAKVVGFELLSIGVPMLCLVTDKGYVNWFRLG